MTPIRRLREALIELETALQAAGAALIEAEQAAHAKEDAEELRATMRAFGIGGHQHRRREWLIEMGMLERWHQGLCASSTAADEPHAPGHVSRALIENTEA